MVNVITDPQFICLYHKIIDKAIPIKDNPQIAIPDRQIINTIFILVPFWFLNIAKKALTNARALKLKQNRMKSYDGTASNRTPEPDTVTLKVWYSGALAVSSN